MLDSVQLDALDIATPRDTHADIVRLAAQNALAVLCQKPLCPTYGEAAALVREVEGRIRLMVHENWRFRPWYRHAKRWMDGDRIGPARQAHMSVIGSGLIADSRGVLPAIERQPFFRTEPRLLVAEVLIHHLDVLRWLLGPLRVVAARLARASDAVVGETTGRMLLETEHGSPVVVEGSLTAHGHSVRARDRLSVRGERGAVELDHDRLRLTAARSAERHFDFVTGYQASFDAAIAHFVDRLADGRPFETGPTDNLETLRLVETVYTAAGPAQGLPATSCR